MLRLWREVASYRSRHRLADLQIALAEDQQLGDVTEFHTSQLDHYAELHEKAFAQWGRCTVTLDRNLDTGVSKGEATVLYARRGVSFRLSLRADA